MHANSRPVESPQQGPHHKLPDLVAKHARTVFKKPPAAYSVAAVSRLFAVWDGRAPLLLDAGCGTGASTRALAQLHPECLCIGVDQSEARLAQGARAMSDPAPLARDDGGKITQMRGLRAEATDVPDNLLILRADVVDIWLLLAEKRVRLAHHYLLYPNPWPKAAQVMRRWPAHPIFPTLLALGGYLECRSNWRVYTEEFAAAVQLLTGRTAQSEAFTSPEPLTPFERKYRDSGHTLWRAAVDLDSLGRPDQEAQPQAALATLSPATLSPATLSPAAP